MTWELTGMVTTDRPIVLAQVPTMKFEGTRVVGQTGCNTFSARASVLTQSMTFGPLFQSRRACTDAERTAQEEGFLNLMQQVIRYELKGTTLTLFSGKAGRLVFRASGNSAAILPPDLQGEWTVARLKTQGGAVALSAPASLNFMMSTDRNLRQFSAATGCNRVFGSLQQSGPVVTFTTSGTTRLTCDVALTAQEGALTEVLNSPLTITRTAQNLVLSSTAGEIHLLRREVAKKP
ncbi:hypothetical protein GCM10008955_02640 [Deinococcus malanensis]|uniref:DUF306 domain-containing protein n=1 Tax=Deinococcus malanensis TaxID=1706855 RepID=A0ABQ2EHN7_9DEIO|nr:hypothetical protein GCM10008955_02640 [Deinococcus malanensis]